MMDKTKTQALNLKFSLKAFLKEYADDKLNLSHLWNLF